MPFWQLIVYFMPSNKIETQPVMLGLLGHPLSHSFSPAYFSNKFEQLKLDNYVYHLFDLPNLESFTQDVLQLPDLIGFNVTIPYKESIIPFLDELDETAIQIGAVNTVVRKGNLWKGYNTDAKGVSVALKDILYYPGNALILGSGGASKAAAYVLKKHGWKLTIWDGKMLRNPKATINNALTPYKLIIQASPLGMYPLTNTFPAIKYEQMSREQIAFDMVYNPEKTIFLARASEAGAKTIGGLPMLHAQAEEAWRIWTQKSENKE